MLPLLRRISTHGFCALAIFTASAFAIGPISFEEISLRLRAGDSPASVLKDVQARKILRPVTAQQQQALATVGAPKAFISELAKPELIAAPEIAADVEKRKEAQRMNIEAQASSLAVDHAAPSPPDIGDGVIYGPKTLVIERIVVKQSPIPPPYFVSFTAVANAERTKGAMHIQGKKYGAPFSESFEPEVEIPINVKLKGVQEDEWAVLKLNIDSDDSKVTKGSALKSHTARIQINNHPRGSIGKPSAIMIPGETWMYEVYWHVE